MAASIRRLVGVAYSFLFIYLLLFAPFRTDTSTTVNCIPFYNIGTDIYYIFIHGSSWEHILFLLGGIMGNVLLLAPIPYFFDLNNSGHKKWLPALIIPITIELLQFILQVGSADVDDVMLNSIGFVLGFRLKDKIRSRRSLPRSGSD